MPSEAVLVNISHAIVLLVNLVTLVYVHHVHGDVHKPDPPVDADRT